jgi:hypothetical protein
MLRKLSVVLSAVATLGLAVAVSSPADAKPQGGNKNVHVNRNVTVHRNITVHRNVIVDRNVNRRFVVGRRYHGHIWYGKNRHRWHGRWYDYGVGPCWINVDGLWFWNVVACPP